MVGTARCAVRRPKTLAALSFALGRRNAASLPEILISVTYPGFLIRARGLALAEQTNP
jgi:hypothetical protein